MADPVLAFEDEIRLGEALLEVSGVDLVVGEDVVADERVEDSGEGGRPDRDGVAGVAQGLAVGRGEEDERLGVMLDLSADRDEDRLVVADQADDVVAGNVVRR